MFKMTLHSSIFLEKFYNLYFKCAYKILKLSQGRNLPYFSFYFLSLPQLDSFPFFINYKTGLVWFGFLAQKFLNIPTGLWKTSTSV